MKLSAANREGVRNFLTGEHGKALLSYMESRTPNVLWDDKTNLERYAISSAEARGWLNYQSVMLKTITAAEEKS